MLKFSKQVDYAIELLLALAAQPKKSLSLREFSHERSISFLFLQRIARQLRIAGIIVAERGAKGGYRLAVMPDQISLRHIVLAVEGDVAVAHCFEQGHTCGIADVCRVRKALGPVHAHMKHYFSETTLAILATHSAV